MPQLYLDNKLNIVGYSADFLLLTDKIVRYAMDKKNIRDLISAADFEKIKRYLARIKALENLPYAEGEKWQLCYRGPKGSDKIGTDWTVYQDSVNLAPEIARWMILKKEK